MYHQALLLWSFLCGGYDDDFMKFPSLSVRVLDDVTVGSVTG